MAKKKKTKVDFSGCPRCGGEGKKVSGFVVCTKCGHRAGTQFLSNLYYQPRPSQQEEFPIEGADRRRDGRYVEELDKRFAK